MTVLFSIIIPHKNSSQTLERLLASIPSNEHIETIIIDDGSDTEEKIKLNSFIEDNIKIIYSSESRSAGKARNIGMAAATGKWLIFADADDYFAPDFKHLLANFKNFQDEETDIIYFDLTSVDSQGKTSYRHEIYSALVNNHNQNSAQNIRYQHTPPWGKIIRKALVSSNKIMFDEVPASNDVMFSIKAGHYARKIQVENCIGYVVTQTHGSITNTVSERNLISKFNVALRANKFLKDHGQPQFQHSILYFLYRALRINPALALRFFAISISEKNNIFIGYKKILTASRTIRKRESR